jgi:pyruvate carboxylase
MEPLGSCHRDSPSSPYITSLFSLSSPTPGLYAPQIPGGQYTNMLFQSKQLGLTGQWSAIKKAYAAANRVMGDVVKVSRGPYQLRGPPLSFVTHGISTPPVTERHGLWAVM